MLSAPALANLSKSVKLLIACTLVACLEASPRAVAPVSLLIEPANRCTDGAPCEDVKPGWPVAYRLALLNTLGVPVPGSRARIANGVTGFFADVDLRDGTGTFETRVPDITRAGSYTMTFEAITPDGLSARPLARAVHVSRPDSRCGAAEPEPDTTSFEFPRGSGHRWLVKRTDYAMGPRANSWSDSPENVWLDDRGQLHLRMTERDGQWYSAEVCSEESFGYGDYVFFLGSRVDTLDPAVVGALFTYETDEREIDIEFSRWGCVNAPNTQYGIQPFGTLDEDTCQVYPFARRGFRFQAASANPFTTHRFTWMPGSVAFSSDIGHVVETQRSLAGWTYAGVVPPPGRERVHMSLWWAKSSAPVMKPTGPQELIVSAVLLPPDLR